MFRRRRLRRQLESDFAELHTPAPEPVPAVEPDPPAVNTSTEAVDAMWLQGLQAGREWAQERAAEFGYKTPPAKRR